MSLDETTLPKQQENLFCESMSQTPTGDDASFKAQPQVWRDHLYRRYRGPRSYWSISVSYPLGRFIPQLSLPPADSSAKDKETPSKSCNHIQRIYLNAALSVTERLLNWSSRNSAASVMEGQVREAAWWDTKKMVFQGQGSLVWIAVLTRHGFVAHINVSKLQSPYRKMRIKLCTLRGHLENKT